VSAVARCALLDVNVLIALAWPNHTHHRTAHTWFEHHQQAQWATTPVTETGFVRVSSNRAAIPAATSPQLAIELLAAMTALGGHEFWVDDVPLVSAGSVDDGLITSHLDVTDAHLLALAERHGGTLVTFDKRIGRLLGTHDPAVLSIQG